MLNPNIHHAELNNDINNAKKALLVLGPIFGQAVDIHTHTTQIGNICREHFWKLDDKYKLSQPMTLQQVIDEISQFSNNDPSVKAVLNSIQGFPGSDNETNLPLQQLLMRTWYLAKNAKYTNAQHIVLDNLKHNLQAGGGCLQGISARLVQPYSIFVDAALENLHNVQNNLLFASNNNSNDDDQLQRIVQQSLLEAEQRAKKEEEIAIQRSLEEKARAEAEAAEKDELELALAMSRSQPSPYQPIMNEKDALLLAFKNSVTEHRQHLAKKAAEEAAKVAQADADLAEQFSMLSAGINEEEAFQRVLWLSARNR